MQIAQQVNIKLVKIAIDAQGGDFGSEPIIKGVCEALKVKDFHAVLVGKEEELRPQIPKIFLDKVSFVEAKEVFLMNEGATDVIKRKETSIYKAIDLVKTDECDAVVSAGHSGATMSLATLRIGRLANVSRPGIATLMPTSCKNKKTLVLDVGANTDCKPDNLFEYAVMGDVYAREILKIKEPKVGLLSNGEEDCKGNDITKSSFELLKKLDSFTGNIEGNHIFDGSIDVVVCDGFVGNILLKTSEGVASAISKIIKENLKKSPFATFGAILMNRVFKKLKTQIDYDEYGGAPLLGIKKCVIISHGKSSPKAIKNAIFQAIKFTDSNINSAIESKLVSFHS